MVPQHSTVPNLIEFVTRYILIWKRCPGYLSFVWYSKRSNRKRGTHTKSAMPGKPLQKDMGNDHRGQAGNWPCWEGYWHRKKDRWEVLLSWNKGSHDKSHCLLVPIFRTCRASRNQLTMITDVALEQITNHIFLLFILKYYDNKDQWTEEGEWVEQKRQNPHTNTHHSTRVVYQGERYLVFFAYSA